jgi:hypothetical protein
MYPAGSHSVEQLRHTAARFRRARPAARSKLTRKRRRQVAGRSCFLDYQLLALKRQPIGARGPHGELRGRSPSPLKK